MIFKCCMLHAEKHATLLPLPQWYLQKPSYLESGSLSLAVFQRPQTLAENSWSFFPTFYSTFITLRVAVLIRFRSCLPLLLISTYSSKDYASDNPISGLWDVNRLSRVNYEPDETVVYFLPSAALLQWPQSKPGNPTMGDGAISTQRWACSHTPRGRGRALLQAMEMSAIFRRS